MKTNKFRITSRIPREMYDELVQLAKKANSNIADLARRCLDNILFENKEIHKTCFKQKNRTISVYLDKDMMSNITSYMRDRNLTYSECLRIALLESLPALHAYCNEVSRMLQQFCDKKA